MRTRTQTLRPARPLPLLEIDEDGIGVSEHQAWGLARFKLDDRGDSVQLGDWPSELDE